ncbi:MAG: ABC transporter permease [Clostridiales bacterium]|jgi:spermidine/putrescine transport system permease protein|nr:ABC transporter permease [Clostridiales bacterium]
MVNGETLKKNAAVKPAPTAVEAEFYKKRKLNYYFGRSYVYLLLLLIYVPIIMIVIYSFSKGSGFQSFRLSFDNIKELFTLGSIDAREMLTALKNTLTIGVATAFFSTFFGTLGAVGINSMKKKGRNALLNASNIPIFSADIVIGIALMLLFANLNITKGFATITISQTAVIAPYVMLSVLPRIKQMNMSVYEAALDLGASPLKAFGKVIIPEIMPGMLSGFILAFTLSMDDFVIAQYTKNNSFQTLSTYVYTKIAGKGGLSGALKPLSALIFFTVLAVLLIYNFKKSQDSKKQIKK